MLHQLRSRMENAVYPEHGIEAAGSEPASAASVVKAAARLLGKPPPPPAALEDADVLWDWQLARLSDEEYARLGYSPGWKAAIARALKGSSSHARRPLSELPLEMRRFLLVPEPGDSEATLLHSFPLWTIFSLLMPRCDGSAGAHLAAAKNTIVTLCELVAVLAGLMLSVPLSLRTATGEDVLDWETAPISALSLDTLAHVVICALVLALFLAFFTAWLAL